MATINLKHEGPRCSPGPTKMLGGKIDRPTKCSREQSYVAMQGLIMAEDRRTQEKEVNFQNLMEYREAPASPSASSVTTTLSLENCGSPPDTPNSPSPQEPQEMDDERLPNELLDELCEDIGMKEGMELDFVEFLMEQDMVDPQQYMTPEALRSSGFPTPTNLSQNSSTLNTPTNKSVEHSWGNNRNCDSPSYSIASSTNVTVATSSGSSSPVSKRFHLSNSGPPSPPALIHAGSHMFKAPQTPPTPRRPLPVSQGAVSPRSNLSVSSNHSDNSDCSNHSNHSSVHSSSNNGQNLPQHCYSPRSVVSGMPSPQLPHSTTGASGYNNPPPQYGQSQGQCHNIQKTSMSYQRLGRAVPPNVNVQNMQQPLNKFVSPAVVQSQGNIGGQPCSANSSGNLGNIGFQGQGQAATSHFSRPIDSPLDQGYFTSSDSVGTRSLESGVSTVHASVSNSVHAMNSQHKIPVSANPQKSIQFAEGPSACVSQNGSLPYEPCYRTNVPDCELEEYRNSIQKMHSKMMPRLNHHVKPESAPYTVPINNGQTIMNPFEYSNPNNMQPLDYHQKPSSNGFGMDNNQNLVMQNYSENMPGQPNMSNMSCQMPSCNNLMGPMHQSQMDPYGRGQSACQMQDAKSPALYDPMNMQNNMMKNNCEFAGQSQGNMNENCGMMGMNQGIMASGSHMSSAQQAGMNPNFSNGQNFQNSQPVYRDQRQIHMNMTSASGSTGMMGYEHQFEQNHAMSANMDMNNIENGMYPQNQGTNINWAAGAMPITPQQPHQMGAAPHSNPMGMPGQAMGMDQGQCGQLVGLNCVIPNCANCKNMASPNRPPMMSSHQRFIQHLISDRSNAFRSHPLFPLLRDLIITDMNFSTPNFPYQLLSNLPADFDKLLQNFLHRNPPSGNYQTNYAVESVVMDALKYAHHCLIEKIHQKQEQDADKQSKSSSKSLSAIEEFCNKFTHQPERKCYIKPATLHAGGGIGPDSLNNMPNCAGMGPIGPPEMGTPQKDFKFSMGMSNMVMQGAMFMSPQAKKGLEFGGIMSPGFKGMMDYDSSSDCGSIVSSSSHPNKPESKKHPSLPKEAVAIMLDWLRQHKDNPYPNDDEKAMLIKQTGLTINQINYWFTNARRRILPKWAQQCKT